MNQLSIAACIVERDVLRYTPAGVPIVGAVLRHSSSQKEAEVMRNVGLETTAFAAGEISQQFANLELGAAYMFSGFLANKARNSKAIVFHVTAVSSAS